MRGAGCPAVVARRAAPRYSGEAIHEVSDWGEIRTQFIWEQIRNTEWEDRARITELMDIEAFIHTIIRGGPAPNRIEVQYLTGLLEKYPAEWEQMELEIRAQHMCDGPPCMQDDGIDALGDPDSVIAAIEQALRDHENGQQQ